MEASLNSRLPRAGGLAMPEGIVSGTWVAGRDPDIPIETVYASG